MARWKARGRLYRPIRRNWTFFANSYDWDVMSENRSKSAFFEGGGSLWAQISEWTGHRPPTTVGVRKLEWLPFRVVPGIKIFAVRCLVLSQYTHLTDGQTDRRTEFRQQYRALHYMQSHGNKMYICTALHWYPILSEFVISLCNLHRYLSAE